MKNKVALKKMIMTSIIACFLFLTLFGILIHQQYQTYTYHFNEKISSLVSQVIEKYPEIEISDLMAVLNNKENDQDEILKEYGIDLKKDSIVIENDKKFHEFLIIDIDLFVLFLLILSCVFFQYQNNQHKKIEEIINYIEEINKKNYKLEIEDNTEDELSILKNELYKTTIMLKELAENSIHDKTNLKESLSDISHQLKTPLTSILIMLDNILDHPDMEENIRNDFLRDIKREMINIKFLVESILKLSKFDSSSVTLIRKEVTIQEIIAEAVKNVEIISELYHVEIKIFGSETDKIICDARWQVEAITNLLKNGIEHSKENGEIHIRYEQNKVYTKIEIRDFGTGIDEEDLPHIFERFYKGKNASNESVGIGLALAKSIIESDHGYIQVDSEKNNGTTFVIKYLQ